MRLISKIFTYNNNQQNDTKCLSTIKIYEKLKYLEFISIYLI